MKWLLRIYAIELLGLYFVDIVASGLVYQDKLVGILITAGALAVGATLVKPIINILILPLSLATLGLMKFFSNAIILYLVDLALDQFKVTGFNFAGLTSPYLDLPAFSYGSGLFAYIAFAALISTITGLAHWLTK